MSDSPAHQLTHQLATDLSWLESYASERANLQDAVVPLRLAAALLRNQVGPFLQGRSALPLHVAVVGGAGTGKSTVVNFLIGRSVAEANPQAGFTRHPVAYVAVGSDQVNTLNDGVLGPLKAIPGPTPSDRDEDVFQVRQVTIPLSPLGRGVRGEGTDVSVPPDTGGDAPGTKPLTPSPSPQRGEGSQSNEPLHDAVVWDCPDMTTWKANQYQVRLVETIGLADLVLYVASDERYNDAWPTQYLQYLLQAGKPVVACLTKMQPTQVETLLKHFRETVIARIPECAGVSAVVALPHLSAAEQAEPAGVGDPHRQPILQAVQWWLKQPVKMRADSVQRAVRFLGQFQETLLAPARHELAAVAQWDKWVSSGASTFTKRYYNEHLTGEQFPHFSAAMIRLMEQLELPGVGQYVSKAMHFLRSPYRWVKSWVAKPTVDGLNESQVLRAGFQGWLDHLRHDLLLQDQEQTVWKTMHQAYQQQGDKRLLAVFEQRTAEFCKKQEAEVETTARAIHEDLAKNPTALNTLRGLKFSVEAASLTGIVFTAGSHLLLYPILLPLVASVTQGISESLGKHYIDGQREKARTRLLDLFSKSLVEPMASELKRWPETLLPNLPKLREISTRLPENLAKLQQELKQRTGKEVA